MDNEAGIETQIHEGHTPLYLAAKQGHLAIVRILILRQASLNSPDNQRWTPLHKAIFWKHTPVTGALIDNGTRLDTQLIAGTYMEKRP